MDSMYCSACDITVSINQAIKDDEGDYWCPFCGELLSMTKKHYNDNKDNEI
jgi:predicted RNA-binding Zn-ribbon protein involved in translation (DUF1610 family)